ncbi:hypothetical protein [Parasitella parasitica]|uniref:Uncharacterized protein n=1 Tax=Parasitella parasitica TaxID=35722 RepID=A0A0B7N7P5_9FUNG|nr:hypothetical protein [Parasitella parasitica]
MVRPRRIYILNSSRIAEEEHFYDVAHRFRSSLCELEIYCACDSHISRNFGSLFSYLASFPLLDSLTIKNSSRRNMVYFEKLLDTCKHLKYLNFQLDHPFFEREQDFYQPGLEYPSMYELDIYLSNFEPHKLQYLVQRFTHLKKLSLRINQNDKQQKDLESIKHYFRYDFIHFISKLDSFYFDFDIKRRSYLEDLIESSYLPSFLGKISLDISMNSMFVISHGRSEEAQLKITKKEKKHFICYRVVRDFSTLNQAKQQGDTTKQLPYIPHLHLYGQHLQSLDIFITPHGQKYEALTVNSVVDLCPNLQKLSIGVNFNQKSDLPLEHQHPAPHHWVHNPERALKSKLATLIIQGMAISSDIVRAIARQYPNLKNFELLECFSEATDTPDTTYNGRVAFFMYDLSNLHLDLLKFDVRWYRCSKDSVVPQVIVVVEEQDQIRRFYLAKYKVMAVDLFQDITRAHFEQAVTSTESPITVVWLKVKLVNRLMLIADVNKKTPYNIFLHGGSKEEYYNRLYRPS